ncbi:HAD family hydrolase [Paenibacillus cremeus]|uniref:HAD family hydrolase n=1 Tax=Paenibacillus cremeus TaxID=2163881 RepID=A0A559K4B0_9BACL|nr:HAD family hydrolase [Paenibacillus cremeus]TVY06930.1 HAD family hydrolase [Paenibacillus cremeus]
MKDQENVRLEPHRLHGKQAIFFDVNQTLVQQGLSFEVCFKQVWEEYAGRWLQDEPIPADRLWGEYNVRWQQRKKIRATFKQLDALQQQCLREAFHVMSIPVSASMPQSFLLEVRRLQTSAKTTAPGTIETLDDLSRHYMLAIISNSPRGEVLQLLERFGLAVFFPIERIFTAQKPVDKKPAPYLFRGALQSLQLAPRQAVMVGNSWKHDVCGAVKAGMDAIWLQASSGTARSEATKISQQRLGKRTVFLVQALDQLPELLT